jgi:hypothetical protein
MSVVRALGQTDPVSSNAAADASHERGVLTAGLAGYRRCKCWSWIGIVHGAQAPSLRSPERCPALGQIVEGVLHPRFSQRARTCRDAKRHRNTEKL